MLDPDNPSSWPPHLRERDICKRADYPGLVPMTQSTWRDAVSRGLVPPPTMFGPKIRTWTKEQVLDVRQHGLRPRRREVAA